jgi:hypothetical protein
VWTTIRFLHVLSAIAWVGVQLTLFALFPVLRAQLEPDRFGSVARAAGMRLGLVAAVTLPLLLATGLAGLTRGAIFGARMGRCQATAVGAGAGRVRRPRADGVSPAAAVVVGADAGVEPVWCWSAPT